MYHESCPGHLLSGLAELNVLLRTSCYLFSMPLIRLQSREATFKLRNLDIFSNVMLEDINMMNSWLLM